MPEPSDQPEQTPRRGQRHVVVSNPPPHPLPHPRPHPAAIAGPQAGPRVEGQPRPRYERGPAPADHGAAAPWQPQPSHTGLFRRVNQQLVEFGVVRFQEGTPLDVGANGMLLEDLIDLARARLEHYQAGPMPCDENAKAIELLQQAADLLRLRTQRRRAQGVDGTTRPHHSTPPENDHVGMLPAQAPELAAQPDAGPESGPAAGGP
jgi:hypothetical protein